MNEGVLEIAGKILKPDRTRILKGSFGMLQVETEDGAAYQGVFAIQAFPVSSPQKYVFLFYYDQKDRIQEIGMIEDISLFPPDVRKLVTEALGKHYYAYEILRIYDLKLEFGLLHFDVETNRGPRKFCMRWEHHRAVDFGENGKILLDVFDDRYVIPNVEELPNLDRELFTRFIFW